MVGRGRKSLAQEYSKIQYKIRKAYLTKQHCPTKYHRPQAVGLSPGCLRVLWSSERMRGSWRRRRSLRLVRMWRRWFSRLPIGRGLQISGSYWGYSYLIHLNIKLFYQAHLSTFQSSYLWFPICIYLHIRICFIERFRSYKM